MTRALILVDLQPTFCEGGELATAGANAVAEACAEYARSHRDDYALVATTQDWHIDPGDHFSDTPDFVDTWPPHGIADSPNAQLHPALDGFNPDVSVKKGHYAASYSGFDGVDEDGRHLADILREAGVDAVDVIGLVLSHCVAQTALDAQRLGFATRVFTDLSVPVSQELGDAACEQMRRGGVEVGRVAS
ncbi:isochorismatase family protein [Nanchangia anserum]|uniref:nicotinamidase n=1 Tax=Nanchangia anserum TaxID=2692125 RepID=A0A8I0GDI2_9ACTO|nr:isochorismatase family protein [Nanchangia anserum]MBD3689553.1 isochorismatase family protein [Nanchangia anserum]QOX81740.1 isochorismatase family protein [Nanchangia anserum]